MNHLHVKYLLIGAGVASHAAAEAIREIDPDGALLLVGQEISRPYHRPPLSKSYLRGEQPREELFTRSGEWYGENRVELRTGRRAVQLDPRRRTVTLDDGSEISFDKLLLATGGVATHLSIPGAELPNLFYLRTLEDADRLRHAIDKARAEGRPHLKGGGRGRVVVIGAGLLGVEVAASLTQLGLEVCLAAGRAYPWSRFAGEATGRFIMRYLQEHGVQVYTDRRPSRLEGDGRVQRVILDESDPLECDFAVAAVGMTVPRDLFRGTAISVGRAILVDARCRTSEPDIFAAGDCAAIYDPLFDKHRLLEHWDSARVTGALAGRNMAGVEEPYSGVSSFFSDLFDLSMTTWGEGRLVERRILRGAPVLERPDLIEFGVGGDGRLAQIIAIGHEGEDDLLRELIARRLRIEGREEQLKDPAFSLANLLH